MSRFIRTYALLGLVALCAFVYAAPVLADNIGTGLGGSGTTIGTGATPTSQPSGTLANPLNNISTLPQLLTAILNAVVQIGSIILVLALVYSGFLFVAAQGNEEKIRSARTALMWTVIGGLILLGATAIQAVITSTVQGL